MFCRESEEHHPFGQILTCALESTRSCMGSCTGGLRFGHCNNPARSGFREIGGSWCLRLVFGVTFHEGQPHFSGLWRLFGKSTGAVVVCAFPPPFPLVSPPPANNQTVLCSDSLRTWWPAKPLDSTGGRPARGPGVGGQGEKKSEASHLGFGDHQCFPFRKLLSSIFI